MRADLASDMGRQKTLWINEACWEKLEQMDGDSVSDKVRRCIMDMDADHDMLIEAKNSRIQALKKQVKILRDLLKSVGWKGDLR